MAFEPYTPLEVAGNTRWVVTPRSIQLKEADIRIRQEGLEARLFLEEECIRSSQVAARRLSFLEVYLYRNSSKILTIGDN